MNYSPDQKVRIYHNGVASEGVILSKADFSYGELLYWIKHNDDVSLFSEDRLNGWNMFGVCDCGSVKTNQPGHSYYCSSLSLIT